MTFIDKPFDDLTASELYDILQARAAVFVVEQRCAYPDSDGLDRNAWHLWSVEAGRLTAYLRILPRSDRPGLVQIGRVLTLCRGQGLGAALLDRGIELAREKLKAREIFLEAQTYARGFYERAGFRVSGDEFLEDGIPHLPMTL